MIAEYKFYHGVVFAELINHKVGPLTIDELIEDGRLSSYILDGQVGLQIKHSTNRMHPWQFTFTKANLVQLLALQQTYDPVFVVLVCNDDGMVTLSLDEITDIMASGESEQAWIRVDRRKSKQYSVVGGAAELPGKCPQGVSRIIQALDFTR